MALTIQLSPTAQIALESEAAARNLTHEETASQVIDTFFELHGVREENYDAWFRAKVEEGLEEARQGRFVPHEEVVRMNNERRAWLLAEIAKGK